jgi:hypothetical protein
MTFRRILLQSESNLLLHQICDPIRYVDMVEGSSNIATFAKRRSITWLSSLPEAK